MRFQDVSHNLGYYTFTLSLLLLYRRNVNQTIVDPPESDSDLISAFDKSLEIPRHDESCVHGPAYRSRVQFNLRIPRRFAESEASFRRKRDVPRPDWL